MEYEDKVREEINEHIEAIRKMGYICVVLNECLQPFDKISEHNKAVIENYKQTPEPNKDIVDAFMYSLNEMKPFNRNLRGQEDGVFVSDSLFEAILRRLLK